MSDYFILFKTFFRIGIFTFGGGYAMLPFIQKEIVERKKWATEEEILDYFAVGQCTPGVIAVNVATFIGYYKKGVMGGIIATIGVVSPSFIIIMIIASLLQNFAHYSIVQHALAGIQIAVCVLMLHAIFTLSKNGIRDFYSLLIFLIVLLLAFFTNLSTVILIILASLSGIVIKKLKKGI